MNTIPQGQRVTAVREFLSGTRRRKIAELPATDLAELLGALDHAAGYLTERAGQPCADCARHPAVLCEDHAADLGQAGAYRALAGRLGGQR